MVPFPDEIYSEIERLARERLSPDGDPRQRWLERFKPVLFGA